MNSTCERVTLGLSVALSLVVLTVMMSGRGLNDFGSRGFLEKSAETGEVLRKIDKLQGTVEEMISRKSAEQLQSPLAPALAELPTALPTSPAAPTSQAAAIAEWYRPSVLSEFGKKAESQYWFQMGERAFDRGKFQRFGDNWPCMWGEAFIGQGVGDGNKWMCGAHMIQKPCVIYSVGSNGNFKYEDGVKELGKDCEIHVYDPTWGPQGVTKMRGLTYHRVGLGATDNINGRLPLLTLKTMMKENGHTHIDGLKVDIEDAEVPVIASLDRDGWPSVGQFMVEAHASAFKTSSHLNDFLKQVERANLRMFHQELNIAGKACCMEYAFIHKDWAPEIKQYNMRGS